MSFSRPDVYITETPTPAPPISGVSTSVPAFLGVAQKGPVGEPIRITSFSQFVSVFGNAVEGHALFYSVRGFFENGGAAAYVSRIAHYADASDKDTRAGVTAYRELTGIGSASYATFTGDVDVTTVNMVPALDANSGALDFAIDINNGGADAGSFAGSRAALTGAAGAFAGALVGGEWIEVAIDGGPTQRIVFAAGDDDSEAAAVVRLSAILGASVSIPEATKLTITSDTMGNNSSVEVTAVSAVGVTTAIGLSADEATVADEAADDFSAVTFAEIKAHIENTVKTATAGDLLVVTQSPEGYLVLTVSAGDEATSEIDLTGDTNAALIPLLGLDDLGTQGGGDAAAGSAAAAETAFTVKSGYRGYESPGTKGNDLQVELTFTPKHASLGVGLDLAAIASAGDLTVRLVTLTGVSAGSVLKFTGGGNTHYAIVTKAETVLSGGAAQHRVTLSEALPHTFATGTSQVTSIEYTLGVSLMDVVLETHTDLSVNPDADNYILNVVNDRDVGSSRIMVVAEGVAFPGSVLEVADLGNLANGTSEITGLADSDVLGDTEAKTGLHAFDGVEEVSLLVVPPSRVGYTGINANPTIHNKMLDWCSNRRCFAILDAPEVLSPSTAALTPVQAVTYRNDRLGADSAWGALYYPFIEVPNPLGSGRAPVTWVPPSGHVAGIYARTDAAAPPEGGVSAAPAGIEVGRLKGSTNVRTAVSEANHDLLNPAGVNVIRQFNLSNAGAPARYGLSVFGARTLSTGKAYRYIQTRRAMTYFQQSIRQGTLWAVFQNNDFRLWSKIRERVTTFLLSAFNSGQIAGEKVSDAFFVRCDATTNTAEDIENGQVVTEIGIALQRPAEFAVFNFSQVQNGTGTISE